MQFVFSWPLKYEIFIAMQTYTRHMSMFTVGTGSVYQYESPTTGKRKDRFTSLPGQGIQHRQEFHAMPNRSGLAPTVAHENPGPMGGNRGNNYNLIA